MSPTQKKTLANTFLLTPFRHCLHWPTNFCSQHALNTKKWLTRFLSATCLFCCWKFLSANMMSQFVGHVYLQQIRQCEQHLRWWHQERHLAKIMPVLQERYNLQVGMTEPWNRVVCNVKGHIFKVRELVVDWRSYIASTILALLVVLLVPDLRQLTEFVFQFLMSVTTLVDLCWCLSVNFDDDIVTEKLFSIFASHAWHKKSSFIDVYS